MAQPPGTIHALYDAPEDSLSLGISDPPHLDLAEAANDVWVFFDAEHMGQLAGISAARASSSDWLPTVQSLLGRDVARRCELLVSNRQSGSADLTFLVDLARWRHEHHAVLGALASADPHPMAASTR